ncbi:hypothetical protein ACFOWM_03285 [Ferruginibacter yonginensis]|uniref:Lipoprotein n=1 Tax=Ferruginibacter yonginensis TaxID=1310416 RepID=A0ABV8QS85_9BACT
MKYITVAVMVVAIFFSCKKDKFTTAPQITYKSLTSNFVDASDPTAVFPSVNFELTDAEGDVGYNDGKDTAWVYIKSLLTNDIDSAIFPVLSSATRKDFKVTVTASLEKATKCRPVPGNAIHVDTIYYEIYVKDFAKNKSNVIKTGEPVLFRCQ